MTRKEAIRILKGDTLFNSREEKEAKELAIASLEAEEKRMEPKPWLSSCENCIYYHGGHSCKQQPEFIERPDIMMCNLHIAKEEDHGTEAN